MQLIYLKYVDPLFVLKLTVTYVNYFVYVENAVDNVDGAFSIIIKSSRAASVSGFRLNLSQFPLKF